MKLSEKEELVEYIIRELRAQYQQHMKLDGSPTIFTHGPYKGKTIDEVREIVKERI